MDLGDHIRGGSSGGDRGRAFRRTHGVLYASAGLKAGGLGRDALGRFTTFQNELHRINLGLAIQLQDLMVERLRDSLLRPKVSSKRLERAIADRRNRFANNSGFGVGRISWLDKSEAKYWRAIEVGTTQFVGNPIPRGLWGGTLTGAYGGASRYGPYPIAGAPFSVTGGARGGRLRPMGPTYAYRALVASGVARRQAFQMSRARDEVLIKTPILAHNYMHGAWRDFRPRARTTAAVKQALKASGVSGPRALG